MFVKIKLLSFKNRTTVYVHCIFYQYTENLNANDIVYQKDTSLTITNYFLIYNVTHYQQLNIL